MAALGGRPKVVQLRELMAAGDWRAAILLAAKFPALGPHRAAILSAREAYLRPEFQRQVGKSPAALIEAGKAALCSGWGRKP